MKNKKIWIAASFICVILGAVILTAGRLMGGRPGFYIDGRGVHAAGETVQTELVRDAKTLEEFDSMEIHARYADVELLISDRFAVEYCIMSEFGKPVCEVKNGRLTFKEKEPFKTYNIGFFTSGFGVVVDEPEYYIRVEIPKNKKLSEVSFDIESGNLDISSLQADRLEIENEYGDISLDQYEGEKLSIYMESGNLSLGTLKTEKAELENEYGNVWISKAEGHSLSIQLDSCDCRIDRIDFSDTKITDEYGDICLGLPGNLEAYGFDLKTEYGDIRLNNKNIESNSDDFDAVYTSAGNGEKRISAFCESGNIEIDSVK